jgi:hypothetical protein
MQDNICPKCQTPRSQWKDTFRTGYQIDNQVYCSRDCFVRTNNNSGGWSALDDGLARECETLARQNVH